MCSADDRNDDPDHHRYRVTVGYPTTESRCAGARRSLRRREVNQLLNLFVRLHATLTEMRNREEGQTMAEYGVVLGVITIALVAVFGLLADDIEGALNAVRAVLPG
jgi:Flp pilus assembly pilin Flp